MQDFRLPGMVHARVVRPPSYGARLTGVDTAGDREDARRSQSRPRRQFPRGRRRARIPGHQGDAHAGRRGAVGRRTRVCRDRPICRAVITGLAAQDIVVLDRGQAGSAGANKLEATYTRPYLIAWIDRAVLRRRALGRQRRDGVDAYPGRFSRSASDRANAASAGDPSALHPRGRVRLLRPQRRRRRGGRRGVDRARHPGPARCACNGCANRSTAGSRSVRRW